MENIFTNIKKKKIDNKEFYQTQDFKELWSKIKTLKKSSLIVNEETKCIDSLLEVYRNEIFFIPSYKYSLIYDNMVIEKIFSADIFYVVHPLDEYTKIFT